VGIRELVGRVKWGEVAEVGREPMADEGWFQPQHAALTELSTQTVYSSTKDERLPNGYLHRIVSTGFGNGLDLCMGKGLTARQVDVYVVESHTRQEGVHVRLATNWGVHWSPGRSHSRGRVADTNELKVGVYVCVCVRARWG